jgi:hypothetical protein
VFRQAAQHVRFDFVLFLLGVIAGGPSVRKSSRTFYELSFSKKFSTFDCAFFVGGFEDHPVAEI